MEIQNKEQIQNTLKSQEQLGKEVFDIKSQKQQQFDNKQEAKAIRQQEFVSKLDKDFSRIKNCQQLKKILAKKLSGEKNNLSTNEDYYAQQQLNGSSILLTCQSPQKLHQLQNQNDNIQSNSKKKNQSQSLEDFDFKTRHSQEAYKELEELSNELNNNPNSQKIENLDDDDRQQKLIKVIELLSALQWQNDLLYNSLIEQQALRSLAMDEIEERKAFLLQIAEELGKENQNQFKIDKIYEKIQEGEISLVNKMKEFSISKRPIKEQQEESPKHK